MRSILTLFVLFFFMQVSFSQDQSFDELWKQVEDYELEGLPKSAMTVLEVIRAKAEAEGDIPQEIKVLLFKSKFALSLEEDAQLKIINDFKTELEGNEYPVSNFIHSIIGNLYWKYFLNNRWRFYNRTNTQAKVDKNDFRTWDLRTIFDEVAFHYEESLKNGLQLQIDKIDKFDLLVINAPNSRVYRPSLYDFLAHRALDFFKTNETSITKPRYKFEIDSPDFIEDAVTFSQLNIQTPDSTSLQLKALLIYQDLTRFHLKDSTPEALVDLNIKRLSYVREHASFPDVDDLFLQTLQAEKEKYPGQEVSGLYDFEIARLLVEKGKTFDPEKNPDVRWKLKEAHEICAKVLSQFEESPAARNCQILMEEIEKKTISIRAEHLIPNNKKSRLLVSYSNHDQLDLKILPLSRDQFLSLQNQYRAEDQFEFFQKLDMLHTWETNLRNEGDYQSHRSEIVLPELANGLYVVLAMPDPKDNRLFAFTTVQTTNLALTQKRGKTWDIFQIIDRNNGKPIKDVTVTASFTSHRDKSYSVTKTTNNKGEFQVKSTSRYYSVSFKAQKSGETAFYDDYYIRSNGRRDRPKTLSRAFIFSDRSIYRPGQPIYFKAIMLKNDGVSTAVISDEKYMVELRDVNNTEIASMELQSNDFGSIHGSFVLPEGGLTGQYRLKFSSQTGKQEINQSHYISVEEYKRPKFFVEFEPMKESIRLNDSVKVKGEALAYSGPSVTDAKVVYRVSRQVNFPRWFYWYKPWYNSEPQEIAHGETTTDKSGQFEIDFIALPDKSVDRESQPIFNYEIQADITDINGETRSKTMVVRVGYHSILATLNLPDKLDKKKKDYQISIDTKNLNDEFYPTSGMVKILKLKSPGRVLRPRIWPAPDYQVIEKDDFISQFPNEAFQNEHDKNNWERGEVVFESDFDTEQSKTLDLGNIRRWKSGIYVVELEATDAFGETVKDQVKTTVYSDSDDGPSDDQLFVLSTDKTEYKPGDKARVKVASAAHTWVTVDIEKDQKLTRTEILELNNNSNFIEIPVEEDDLGGFAVLISLAAFNSYQTESLVLNVPYPSTELEIETNTFRDKLKPGLEETWSFTVKGPEGEKVAAEMLAGMYDASLDQFKSHDWYFNPFPKSNYYSIGIRNGSRSFGTRDFRLSRRDFGRRSYHSQGYDHLNWFGLDLFNPGAYDQYLFKLRRSRNLSKTGNISGLVNDSSGPLPGVNVMIKGSNTGTQTDFDGMYWIDANPGETLVFSYVGYMTKE
ncbi:MAG: alpha-2-macroglobulin, partial [Flavobacteriaceae bacterium]|nr:alpha-2-macroglobulin [Flavobacteriaceae bacterium]